MVKVIKTGEPGPANLTWEDKNPSSYLFNTGVQDKLGQTISRAKEELQKNDSSKK
ncbi:MAG TPA: hypothetical protein VGK02_07730 [Candidatus Aquicultor sp.]|jgi:hypothetical protein